MKQRSRIPVVVFLALILAATFRAQSPLITNPANLSQFPSIERIRAAIKGTDDVDSHARFMAALWRINDMIKEDLVKAPNGGYYDMPPAAQTVQYRYSGAITRYSIDEPPPAARDPRFRALEQKYEKDPAFFDGLLTQFFSPKFRTDYYAWIGKPAPQLAAGQPGSVPKGPSPDPSIAKAKLFKMDTAVFGMELGQPLSLPTCSRDFSSARPDPNCVLDQSIGTGVPLLDNWLTTLGSGAPSPQQDPREQRFIVVLDTDHCPSWVWAGCQATVTVYDGILVAVAVETNGRKVENSVKAELKAKYGPPNLISNGKITPDSGNAFDVEEPLWLGHGVRVEYQIVVHNETVGVDTRYGWVRVITETAYDRLNKPVKKKM